jgi:hypothetical protein
LTPEQQAVRYQNKELLEEAKAGTIKWTDYAKQANANAAGVIPNSDNLFWQEAFAYRVVLAQKVDEKQITPEEFDYEFKKYLADEQRQRVTNAALIAASMPQPIVTQPIIPRPVTCITNSFVTTCNLRAPIRVAQLARASRKFAHGSLYERADHLLWIGE